MSLLNFSLFKRKTTSQDDSGPFCGYVLGTNSVSDKHESLIHCLIKGLFIFAASFGCISGVLSEFDIAYNYAMVFVIIFITSMALSLMHLNKILFNIGYPVVFVVFSSMLIRCRLYANSGFQALINIINEEYSSHFLMLFTRESTETITNRYLTVTAAAIFIGVFLAILINVGIFHEMYFLTTFNLTFWPLQLGIYIGKYPSFISLMLIFFSYFGIYFLKHSNHYHYINPGKKRTETKAYEYKNKHYIHYKSNAKSMVQLCIFSLVLSLFFSSFETATTASTESNNTNSPLKESADSYVKIFVQNGLSGFFNRYQATGGISGGQLGGVSSVRPDYQTDLIVTFVPYAYETIYLKAYIGSEYTGSQWNEPGGGQTKYLYPVVPDAVGYHEYCTYTEGNTLSSMMEKAEIPSMYGTMMIENVDAASNYLYQPYYTLPPSEEHVISTNENTVLGSTPLSGEAVTLQYIPYSASQTDLDSRSLSEYSAFRNSEYNDMFTTYQEECYDNYLQIPDTIAPELEKYQAEIGTSDDLETQIALIRQYLTTNYTYDMAPGTTPRNEDFVLYFLSEQKRGYCTHFASAAVMLFRSYGIPARYVEGYVVSQLAVSERAQATEYKYEDFFEGENILGTENVVEVDINDGDAHAWIEIFVDGFGWIPVEVTPPSTDTEEPSYADFLSALTGLLAPESDTVQNTTDGIGTEYDTLFESMQFRNSPVVSLFLVILALALAFPALAKCVHSCKSAIARKQDYQKGIYDTTIAYEYRKLYGYLKKKNPETNLVLPEDVAKLLTKLLTDYDKSQWQDNEIADLIALTEKSCFSEKQSSKETAAMLITFYHYAYKQSKRR